MPDDFAGTDSRSMVGTGIGRRGFLGAMAVGMGAIAGCESPADTTAGTTTSPAPTTQPSGQATSEQYSRVYEAARDGVAVVETDASQGSCFGYGDDGHFVTNHHVVDGARSIHLHFSRDDWSAADVVATDVYSDLAVLSVSDPPDYATQLPVLEGRPTIGQEVLVLGSPFGLQGSLTTGVVSGVDRALETPTGFPIPGAIQTDAAVNPGNSGGPMVSLDGKVLGVVTAGGGENIGFGIPPQLVNRVVPALISQGSYAHPFMGVALLEVDPQIAAANGLDRPQGVIVVQVLKDTPSEGVFEGSETEIRDGREVPVGGDVIVALDDRAVSSLADLSTYLSFQTSPGDTLEVDVIREGERQTLTLEVGERPPP